MKKIKFILCYFLLFLLANCTFDYETYATSLELSKNFPSIQIINIRYHNIVDNKDQIVLKSESFYYFSGDKMYKLNSGSFFFKENNIIGKFDKLDGSQVTKNLYMQDNIEIKMEDKDNYYSLITNRLFWKNDEKKLESPPEELVFIRFSDNEFQGKNFSYFFETNVYYFYSGVKGFIK